MHSPQEHVNVFRRDGDLTLYLGLRYLIYQSLGLRRSVLTVYIGLVGKGGESMCSPWRINSLTGKETNEFLAGGFCVMEAVLTQD